MLTLYGHPFSSYTWKARIALFAAGLAHEFRELQPGADNADNVFVAGVGPLGRFPVLVDDGEEIFETSCIVEHLAIHYPEARFLLPEDPAAALPIRRMDRVFDLYVMAEAQAVVSEYLRNAQAPDMARVGEAKAKLQRIYDWLEPRLLLQADRMILADRMTLADCAAAPALFYADWVKEIGERKNLAAYRRWLLARPEVARCVEDARPWRPFFPPGAPDRD